MSEEIDPLQQVESTEQIGQSKFARRRVAATLGAALLATVLWYNPAFKGLTRDRALVSDKTAAGRVLLVNVPLASASNRPTVAAATGSTTATIAPAPPARPPVEAVTAAERLMCARLVERLTALGAKVIVLCGVIPPGDAEADAALAAAVRASGRVIISEGAITNLLTQEVVRSRSADVLHLAAKQTGSLAVFPEVDGVVRRAPLDSTATGGAAHLAYLAAAELVGPGLTVPRGAPWFTTLPRITELPLPIVLLDTNHPAIAAQVRDRAVVVWLAGHERDHAIAPLGSGHSSHSAGWLTAAWIELACRGVFAYDSGDRLGPLVVLLFVALGLLMRLPGRVVSLVMAASIAAAGLWLSGQLLADGVLLNGVGFAWAVALLWIARALG